MTSRMRTLALALALATAPAVAFADQPASDDAQAPPQGPMQVERSHDGFAIAPEFKATHFDKGGGTGWLVGGYGGWMIDNKLLIGAGGDVMTNHTSNVHDMGYFGGVVEWLGGTGQAVGWSVRGLAGLGTATVEDTFTVNYYMGPHGPVAAPNNMMPGRDAHDLRPIGPTSVRVTFHEDFFIFEPQANVLVNLSRGSRITAGVGYRVIGGADSYNNRLRGVTGTIALELGPSR